MIITVIRGLPGSGKSTYAHRLAEKTGAIVIEPDALVTVDGVYRYDTTRWSKARYLARQIMRIIATTQESDIIFADVCPTRREVADMLRDIGQYTEGLRCRVIDMPPLTLEESRKRNRHNVRSVDIEHMIARWEPWQGQALDGSSPQADEEDGSE